MFILQLNEPQDRNRRVFFHLVDSSDGVTAKTGQTGKAYISKNGNTPAQTFNSLVEVSSANMPGLYYIELTVSEVSSPGFITIDYKSGSTLRFQELGQIVAFDPYSRTIGDGQSPLFNGGAPDIDYKKIRKIIEEVVEHRKPHALPEFKETNLTPIIATLHDLNEKIGAIPGPIPQEKYDHTPVMNKLEEMHTHMKETEYPVTDLSEVLEKLSDVLSRMDGVQIDGIRGQVDALLERIKQYFDGDMEHVKGQLDKIEKKTRRSFNLSLNSSEEDEEEK